MNRNPYRPRLVSDGTRDESGVWTPDLARGWLEYTRDQGYPVIAAEFFNEPSLYSVVNGTRVFEDNDWMGSNARAPGPSESGRPSGGKLPFGLGGRPFMFAYQNGRIQPCNFELGESEDENVS